MKSLPIIAITMGDPSGNGPELCVQALSDPALYEKCKPIVVADATMIELAKKITHHDEMVINCVDNVQDALFRFGTIDVFHLDLVDLKTFAFGKVSTMCGNAAFQCVIKAIDLALQNKVDATVTNALNKEALNLALEKQGKHFDGHTEIYATYTHTQKYTMMLAHHNLRVVHVSTHCSLRQACDCVKKARVLEVIQIAHQACKDLGIAQPKIGVAGLNPHSGENGLFGREEIDEIIPAIEAAKQQGILVQGPIPPDTLFPKALGGWYDVVVAMYHDQGHIPLKTVGFVYDSKEQKWQAVEGVNVTLGLPIIRTSVDHGTGFDQAGKGTSSPLSLMNAIQYAIQMAAHGDNRTTNQKA